MRGGLKSIARRALPWAERIVEHLRVLGDVEPPPLVLEPGELDLRPDWTAGQWLARARACVMFGALARLEAFPRVSVVVRGHTMNLMGAVEVGTLGTYRELHVVVASLTAPPRLIEAVATRVLPTWHSREWDDDGRLHLWGES